MGLEFMTIPEDSVEEVILVIRSGLADKHVNKTVSAQTRDQLRMWCERQEEYRRETKNR